jgi:hypothetical protein
VWFGGGDFSVPVAFFRFLRLSRILKFSKSRAHFFPDRYPTGEGALFALAKKAGAFNYDCENCLGAQKNGRGQCRNVMPAPEGYLFRNIRSFFAKNKL